MTVIPNLRAAKALVLAPLGRDAAVASALLRQAGIPSALCADIDALQDALNEEAFFAVVTEEALQSADLRAISSRLQAQPAWSDFPFVVLTRRDGNVERNTDAVRFSDLLGNVTFLERPFHSITFISVAQDSPQNASAPVRGSRPNRGTRRGGGAASDRAPCRASRYVGVGFDDMDASGV